MNWIPAGPAASAVDKALLLAIIDILEHVECVVVLIEVRDIETSISSVNILA